MSEHAAIRTPPSLMSTMGEVLFRGRPFIRWTLSPFLILTMAILPVCCTKWTPGSMLMMATTELMGLALLVGFWASGKLQHYSFRCVTAVVLMLYAGYFIQEFFFSDHPFIWDQPRDESSPKSALLGLVAIGLPCLWFTLFGRFTLHPAPEIPEEAFEEDDWNEDDENAS